ncbi:MAG: M23 family metallopeptidase [Candidatus Riflebacteria bacterium]|nr:M23 family metallopeptidase [Candidatus Riflebacteria bacterium]
MTASEIKPLTNRSRALIILLALVLLQLIVPVNDSEALELSASFYAPVKENFNFWLPARQLLANAVERAEDLRTRLQPVSRTYKIVSVTSKKIVASKDWPVKGAISSAFGMRRHPVTKRNSFHNGIDIKARLGTNIVCPTDGIVVCAAYAGLLGRLVKIRTGDGKMLYFGHMHKLKCIKGQRVKRGNIIGTVGSSGRATGPHLHFSVFSGRHYINPIKYLSAQ